MAYTTYPTPAMTLAEFQKYCNSDVQYEIHKPDPDAGIAMHAAGGDEMLKVTKNGFYVRGKKVEQDDKEAEVVYNAFKQWLSWAQLQRN
jgi:hypothetical protein